MVSRTVRVRRRALLPEGIGEFLRRRLVELGGLALMALAGALALGLATYSPVDESFNSAGNGEIANGAGRIGAYAADIILQGAGVAGSTLVLIFLAWGWGVFSHRGLPRWGLRVGLVPIGVLTAAAGVAALPQPADWPIASGTGGSLGLIVARALLPSAQAIGMGVAGFAALAFALSLAALALAFGLSLSEWRAIGRGFLNIVLFVGEAALKLARALAAREARQRVSRRVRPSERAEPRLFGRGDAQDMATDEEEGFPLGSRQDRPPFEIVERRRAKAPSKRRGAAERQRVLDLLPSEGYRLPPLDLLTEPPTGARTALNQETLAQNARLLESVLEDFGVQGEIVKVRPGPVVTLYELEPAPGTKSSRVIGLADDIARYMSAISVRAAVIPGRNVIGIELPNATREMVYLRELLSSDAYEKTAGRLALALGKDLSGTPTIVEMERMPHLLIAGTTGSGKSVAINSMILSLIYRLPPEQCKFVMIDPKMLELSVYDGIPQLLAPVVTNPSKAIVALKWTVKEMESRYQAMSQLGVRHITSYNKRLAEARARGEVLTRTVQTGFDFETGEPIYEEQTLELDPLPFIIVIVDEMADLMLLAGKEVEAAIQRLSQMARAAGIHLIMATQRPSVDVITGTIKANFPTRISFQVTSKIDSRTIIGEQGAEQLLGQGDMLYLEAGGRITRVHGPFVSDAEVERVAAFLKRQGRPEYLEAVTEEPDSDLPPGLEAAAEDPLYDQAVALICRERKASTSFLQRHLQIGYNRAARIIERMETEGMIGPPNHVGKREVLAHNTAD